MKKIKNQDIELLSSSDCDYEWLTGEFYFKEDSIMQINQDKGLDQIELEIFTNSRWDVIPVKMPLSDLVEALNLLKDEYLDRSETSSFFTPEERKKIFGY